MIRILVLSLLAMGCIPLGKAQLLPVTSARHPGELRVDSIFNEFASSETPGAAVAVLRNGSLIFQKSYGLANLDQRVPIAARSVFSLASVSKQFTAYALLLLEKEGKLSLDDDVRKHLPDFRDYGTPITLRMLANHTSGIRSHLHLLGMLGYTGDDAIRAEEVREVIYRQQGLNHAPGSRFSYSNSGYVLMAEVVERVSGQGFADFVRERILKPVGMEASFVMDEIGRLALQRADSYGGSLEEGFVFSPANYSYVGSTNLYTNLEDMVAWARHWLTAQGETRALLDRMAAPTQLTDGHEIGYGMGQFVGQYQGLKMVSHGGADAGYRTFLALFPESNSAVVLLGNWGGIDAEGTALRVADAFLSDLYLTEFNGPDKPVGPPVVQRSAKELERFKGDFFSSASFLIRNILLQNDTLYYARAEQNGRKTALKPLSNGNFQLGNRTDYQVSFGEGSPRVMSVLQDGREVERYEEFAPKRYAERELEEYEGNYYCAELDTWYRLLVQDGALQVEHPRMGPIRLTGIKKDGFLSDSWRFTFLEFERSPKEVSGFRIAAGRAHGVAFVRVKG